VSHRIPQPVVGQSSPGDPLPYIRGLQQLITQQRLEYLLARTSRRRNRKRRIVASHTVWLVIAISLVSTHSIPQVWRLLHPTSTRHEPDESAFTQARQRLGVTVMRMLFEEFAATLAPPGTRGVFHRGWRLMAIDGTTFNLPDTPANDRIFGRGHNQRSRYAYPQVRVLALCEVGTHAVCDVAFRPYCSGEQEMVPHLLPSLQPGMLLLWDRGFFGFDLITSVLDRGSHLLARVKTSRLIFERRETLSDGSYLTKIYRSAYDRVKDRNGRVVRIIEYTIDDPKRKGHDEKHRLLTDILDPTELPALEAATLYHERWESELVFAEIKTHLNGREVHLRSKTPRGVIQELYGLFLAHRIVRQVMLDAAQEAKLDPDRLSFTNTLRILQAQLPEGSSLSPEEWYEQLVEEASRQRLRPRRDRWYPRVVKRKMSKWDKKQPRHLKPPQPTKPFAQSVVIT
jgi:Transposase DDE domain/Insertion element 4 transposase N-terminal